MESKPIIQVRHINKVFPGVHALKDISIEFEQGKILGLVGENGAGKSTLIKMLTGAYAPTDGEIIVDGKSYSGLNVNVSRALGIGCVYQEFNLSPVLSVAENIFMGEKASRFVNFKYIREESAKLFERLGVKINPKHKVGTLTTAYLQLVEIAKALSKNIRFLILDEPTATLTNDEVEMFFEVVKKLKSEGVTIVFISHRFDELYEICDNVAVMRDGQLIAQMPIEEAPKQKLISLMVGREMKEQFPPRLPVSETSEVLFEAKNVCGNGDRDISFKIRKGEILGMAGLVGAGRTEFVRMIFGADKKDRGEFYYMGKKVNITCPRDAVAMGIAMVPEDRKHHGCILSMPIKHNISLPILRRISGKLMLINMKEELSIVNDMKNMFAIKTPSISQLVKNLSGGNQQKVILAKWMASNCKLLILDEPTRGIDVGAKREIYDFMNRLTDQGVSIIMISSEMEELLGMSDRIIVLSEGEKIGEIYKEDFSQERVLRFASKELNESDKEMISNEQ